MWWMGASAPRSAQRSPRTVLITGASVGLGLAIARRLLERTGHRLVLSARAGSLPRFAEEGIRESARVLIRPLDVVCHDERVALIRELDQRFGGVDVLVNNAGISYRSVLEHAEECEVKSQMGINFHGPMELIRLVLPTMREKGAGRIINVSSVSGMMAMPTMGLYTASKFALEGATESLWYEVKPFGIKVSLVQPGFIHSDGFQKVRMTPLSQHATEDPNDAYHPHYGFMAPFIRKLMTRTSTTPEKVAKVIVRVMHQRWPKLRVPATWDARFFYYLRRLLPRRVYHGLLYSALPGVRTWGRQPRISTLPSRVEPQPAIGQQDEVTERAPPIPAPERRDVSGHHHAVESRENTQ